MNNFYWLNKLAFQKTLLEQLPKLTSKYCNRDVEAIIIDKLVKEINKRNLVVVDKLD
jgi:hypothetical protein